MAAFHGSTPSISGSCSDSIIFSSDAEYATACVILVIVPQKRSLFFVSHEHHPPCAHDAPPLLALAGPQQQCRLLLLARTLYLPEVGRIHQKTWVCTYIAQSRAERGKKECTNCCAPFSFSPRSTYRSCVVITRTAVVCPRHPGWLVLLWCCWRRRENKQRHLRIALP